MPRSGMAAHRKIVDLRNLLAERFVQPTISPQPQLIKGIPAFDAMGGLPKAAITEVISPSSSAGAALLLHHLLHFAASNRFFMALVDGRDSFDVEAAGRVAIRHLLWLRCATATEGIKAADLLLRDGNFPLVVLDLILNVTEELRRIPANNWYRLQRLAEAAPVAFVVMSRHNLVPSAHLKLVLENRWHLSDLPNDNALKQLRLRPRRTRALATR